MNNIFEKFKKNFVLLNCQNSLTMHYNNLVPPSTHKNIVHLCMYARENISQRQLFVKETCCSASAKCLTLKICPDRVGICQGNKTIINKTHPSYTYMWLMAIVWRHHWAIFEGNKTIIKNSPVCAKIDRCGV